MSAVNVRRAEKSDLDQLVALEMRCFAGDRLNRRNFKYMLTKAHGQLWVAEDENGLLGYVLILFHRGTSLARLYSIAIDVAAQGKGLADLLMEQAEHSAKETGCVYMRLEVREDNTRAVRLYERRGYRYFGRIPDYYEDGCAALRYEKALKVKPPDNRINVPYYAQTTEFTCGPSALMMAMRSLDPQFPLDRNQELRIWREATTIFMTSGHGGCGPHGLALAAWRRGFWVKLFISQEGPLFVEGVRSDNKKEVLALVHEEFEQELEKTDVEIHKRGVSSADIQSCLTEGGVPIVLISTYQFNRVKAPHWVVVTALDDRFVYINDPEIDEETFRLETDNINLPIPRQHFDAMAKFGQTRLRTAVLIYGRTKDEATESNLLQSGPRVAAGDAG